jgi:hypothetical protein
MIYRLEFELNSSSYTGMSISLALAEWLTSSDKDLVHPLVWRSVDHKGIKRELCLLADVTIEGAQPQGLRFRASVFSQRPNSATFQLECAYDPPQGKTVLPLYRFEWNPVSGHVNKIDVRDGSLRGRIFAPGETHEHSCLDHATDSGMIGSRGVHCARPILINARSFHDALTYVCARIHINGASGIEIPQTQWQLL